MAKFRNISGTELFIPAIGKAVEDDGVFDVPDNEAHGFACQPSNYIAVEGRKAAKESE